MKIYKLPDGTELREGQAFVADRYDGETLQLPANWLANATLQELEEFGIIYEEFPDPEPEPIRRLVQKSVIVDRLQEAGLLAAARTALDQADLYTQERWNARDSIYADDPTAFALLVAIGADPNKILAE